MKIYVNKTEVYLQVLRYTALAGTDAEIIDGGENWIIEYSIEFNEQISRGIEEHIEYNFNFPPEIQELVIYNAGLEMTKFIEDYLDSVAQKYRYDDIKSVRSYTGFPNVFQEECIALASWSAECWKVAGDIEQEVISGTRDLPTHEELLTLLPSNPLL